MAQTVNDGTDDPLTADLRQRSQSANLHLQKRVLLRLVGKSPPVNRETVLPSSVCVTKVYLMITEETCPQPTVRGEPDTVASLAVGMSHRRDDPHRAGCP